MLFVIHFNKYTFYDMIIRDQFSIFKPLKNIFDQRKPMTSHTSPYDSKLPSQRVLLSTRRQERMMNGLRSNSLAPHVKESTGKTMLHIPRIQMRPCVPPNTATSTPLPERVSPLVPWLDDQVLWTSIIILFCRYNL